MNITCYGKPYKVVILAARAVTPRVIELNADRCILAVENGRAQFVLLPVNPQYRDYIRDASGVADPRR